MRTIFGKGALLIVFICCVCLSSCGWRTMEAPFLEEQLESPDGVVNGPRVARLLLMHEREEDMLKKLFRLSERMPSLSPKLRALLAREGPLRMLPELITTLPPEASKRLQSCLQQQETAAGEPKAFQVSLSCLGIGKGELSMTLTDLPIEAILSLLSQTRTDKLALRGGQLDLVFRDACMQGTCLNGRLKLTLQRSAKQFSALARYQLMFNEPDRFFYGGLRFTHTPSRPYQLSKLYYAGLMSGDPDCPGDSDIQGVVLKMHQESDEGVRIFQLQGKNGVYSCQRTAASGGCKELPGFPQYPNTTAKEH